VTPSILYEDNHVLVAVKPKGIPVQGDASGDPDLLSLLKEYIKEKYKKPGAVYLGLVHRLDRPVGGVMVFARTSKAAARLSEQVRTGLMGKDYLCVVQGAPQSGTWRDFLVKDGRTNTSRVASPSDEGAKEAILTEEPVASRDGLTLCRVELKTGRSHQIRVQFSSRGFPLWGDARYNPTAKPGQDIALFAWRLTFNHPTTKERLTFSVLPEGRPWRDFADVWEKLDMG